MKIIVKLKNTFGKNNTVSDKRIDPVVNYTAEYNSLLSLEQFIKSKLSKSHYVAKSEYLETIESYKDTISFFDTLIKSNMLNDYCNKNSLNSQTVFDTLNVYNNFEKLINEANKNYVSEKLISEKTYLDNILSDIDPKIMLDENQRKVVLTDEDHCLVIAGAGAGKTTAVAAKVKYLVEKQNVDPKKILVISFTNKAVNELKDRIIGQLHIECPIATFHSTGNAILRKQNDEKLNIADNSKLYWVLQDYFASTILQNESTVNNLIMFFSSYFDAPYEGKNINEFFNKIAKANYSTMKSELDDFKQEVIDIRTKKSVTIQNEILRSNQEVRIANFLYLNGINYEYEPIYRYDIEFSRKPYTPDFKIWQEDNVAYIEHFGITESGENFIYSEDELNSYKKAINDKISLHKEHRTKLIYTYSEYNDGVDLIKHLEEQLVEAGFEIRPRSNQEVMSKLVSSEESKYLRRLINLLCRFISNFKVNGYTEKDFDRMYNSTQNVRSKLFIDICHDCYLEYQRYLKQHDMVDFQDMINESARILREVKELGQKLDFEYIIVDEYQDISQQRFDLVSALSDVTNAKIIAVGDDWQSIYAFSGSDITLFTEFANKVGYAELLKIVKTYRNSQEVIDIAGTFIQQNPKQIQKDLVSPKHITDPVIIYTYDTRYKKSGEDNRSGASFAIAKAVEIAIGQIKEYNKDNPEHQKNNSILILGRFGFDGNNLEKSGLFEFTSQTQRNKLRSLKYKDVDLTFMTVHSSKGLGYDNVIVINGRNETYGFPSKIEDDPVLKFVVKTDYAIDFAEERRLFYVAMTRTKNRVYFIAPEENPSEFLIELKQNYKNVLLKGEWNEDSKNTISMRKTCPICGFPLQYRYKNAYGLRLYLCTNEPEICSFMTNEYKAGAISIRKCDKCRDGYLIVKSSKNGYFLGCTNYKPDKTGCNNTVSTLSAERPLNNSFTSNQIEHPTKQIEDSTKKEATNVKGYPQAKRYGKVTPYKTPLNEAKLENARDIMFIMLQCLAEISEEYYYGESVYLDVLRGASSKKIVASKLNHTKYYGKLIKCNREELKTALDWLIDNGYILSTREKHPVLHPTSKGMDFGNVVTKKDLDKFFSYVLEYSLPF